MFFRSLQLLGVLGTAWTSLLIVLLSDPPALAQGQNAPVVSSPKFSDEVLSKAEKILAEAGLKRSGKSIATNAAIEVSRGISGLGRSRRSLKLLHDTWKQTASQLTQMRLTSEQLNAQNIQINTQLAQAGLDISTNNRLVAMNNANVATIRQIAADETRVKTELTEKRKMLNDAEAQYAQTVVALRRDFNAVRTKLEESLKDEKVKIAVKVISAHYETPETLTADLLLAPVDKRLKQIETEVFSESIPLEVTSNGSLYVNVSVGDKSARMVLDSGATVISLPSSIAAELGIEVPAGAPALRLVLADGREIPGRAVLIERVRIGQFEAENVEAAVLDPVAVNAEPLLGMSFLGNFKFEIDTASKSLKLLRVKE